VASQAVHSKRDFDSTANPSVFAGEAQYQTLSRSLLRQSVPMHLTTDHVDSFCARVASLDLGFVQMQRIWSGSRFNVHRTSRLIARSDSDFLKVVVQTGGVCTLSQGGRHATLAAGQFVLYDTARPYEISGKPGFHMSAVLIPRQVLRLSPSHLERLALQPISGRQGIGLLVSEYIEKLASQTGNGIESGACHLADATLALLAASFAEQLGTDCMETDDGKVTILRVQAHIERRLSDPKLNIASIASANHISIRTLQKLFEAEGHTATGWIRLRRLEHCRRYLADPARAHQSIGSIGASWGLPDHARFSRQFKAQYGLSPTDYRAAAIAVAGYAQDSVSRGVSRS